MGRGDKTLYKDDELIEPDLLLSRYRFGEFPMSDSRKSQRIKWYFPIYRGCIPIDNFRVSKNILKWIRNKPHTCKINHNFQAVITECAEQRRENTWISDVIIRSYCKLHELGHAHSVEIYIHDELVGGLYGVHIGAAFFGETMFRKLPEMDKVALYYCHQILQKNGFLLWDTQYWTKHLAQFGCIEIKFTHYLRLLEKALQTQARFVL